MSRSSLVRSVTRTIPVLIIALLLIVPLWSPATAVTTATTGTAQKTPITVDFQSITDVPHELWAPIELVVNANRAHIPSEEQFVVASLRQTEHWIYAVLIPAPVVAAGMEGVTSDQAVEILGRFIADGQWEATIFGSPDFLEFARDVPTDFMDLSDLFNPTLASTLSFRFPWTAQHAWYKTQGWHQNFTNSSSYNALDFQPVQRQNPAVDYAVLATEGGRLDSFCSDRSDQSWLKLTHPNGQVTIYGHIQTSTIPSGLLGQQVQRGQHLGRIYINGNIFNSYQTPCGWGSAGHLHFVMPARSVQIDGYWADAVSSSAHATQYRSNNTRLDDASSIAVGQNSSRQVVFQRAFEATREGTLYHINYGSATSGAYWYNGLVRQDFANGVSLIHDEGADDPPRSLPAYPIYGKFRPYWEQNSWLGTPTSNQITNGLGQQEQHFRNGWITYDGRSLSSGRWPSEDDCTSQGKWRLEVANLFHFEHGVGAGTGISWPPNRNLKAGPSLVVCVSPQRSGYAMFFDVGSESPYFQRSTYDQGLWRDHWIARLSGKLSNLPLPYYIASAACDDGCNIEVQSAKFPTWKQQITSWRDQAATSTVGRFWVGNGDRVNITLYERSGLARVWLKLGPSALLPPLSAQCDASISIADSAPVINTDGATLTLSAADASEVRLSNRADLSDASWQPYTTTLEWSLEPAQGPLVRSVYVQFRDSDERPLCSGAILADDILVDPLPPTGTVTLEENTWETARLSIKAADQDEGSGVRLMALQITAPDMPTLNPADLPEEAWQEVTETVTINKPMGYETANPLDGSMLTTVNDLTYQIWFRDAAGNTSAPVTMVVPHIAAPLASNAIYLPLVRR